MYCLAIFKNETVIALGVVVIFFQPLALIKNTAIFKTRLSLAEIKQWGPQMTRADLVQHLTDVRNNSI